MENQAKIEIWNNIPPGERKKQMGEWKEGKERKISKIPEEEHKVKLKVMLTDLKRKK